MQFILLVHAKAFYHPGRDTPPLWIANVECRGEQEVAIDANIKKKRLIPFANSLPKMGIHLARMTTIHDEPEVTDVTQGPYYSSLTLTFWALEAVEKVPTHPISAC